RAGEATVSRTARRRTRAHAHSGCGPDYWWPSDAQHWAAGRIARAVLPSAAGWRLEPEGSHAQTPAHRIVTSSITLSRTVPTPSTGSTAIPKNWDASLYDSKHSFVWKYGAELIELLAPQKGERILDLGSGTGHLTHRIADSGASVFGLDRSPTMLAEARKNYPELNLVAGDATRFAFARPFDAVFSNATLHWILDAESVVKCVAGCLRAGGRFVLELGGRGNIEQFRAAVHDALDQLGYPEGKGWNPKYFP